MVGAEPTDVVPVPLHSGAELLAACLGSSLCSEADEAMRLLRLEGIDVNAKDEIGRTPLHWASHHGHKELALALAASPPGITRPDPALVIVKIARIAWVPVRCEVI